MSGDGRQLRVGDRVRAKQRENFPDGIVVQVLENEFVLVKWNGDRLETAQSHDLEILDGD